MIITRSPLRISLGGGGTDLPHYADRYGGFVIAGAIDKYVYVSINRRFVDGFLLKYSQMEEVSSIEEIQHSLIRESLCSVGIEDRNLEIVSTADIPAGTGLGSSGSFTTALLKALRAYKRNPIDRAALAREACHIEIDVLQAPIGKQDQHAAAYGGITSFEFNVDGSVKPRPLSLSMETFVNLEENLLLFFTGYSRSAAAILNEQSKASDNLHRVKQLGLLVKDALESGDMKHFARLMSDQWELKKQRSHVTSNSAIDLCYRRAINSGALGGKLVGAGGGGFLMFYAEDKQHLRHAMREQGLREVRFRFDFEGTQVLSHEY